MPNCPVCNAPVKEGAKVCSMCGTRLETTVKTIFCPLCGNALKEGEKKCNVCGAQIEQKKKEEKPEQEEPKEMQTTEKADLSLLNSMEKMDNPKPSAEGSSGQMESTGSVDLNAYDEEQEKIKEEEEKAKLNLPTMDAVESPKLNLDELGTVEDEDKSQYPTMDSVEFPGQEKPKPQPQPKPAPKPTPKPAPEKKPYENDFSDFSQPQVVRPAGNIPRNNTANTSVNVKKPVNAFRLFLLIIIVAAVCAAVLLIRSFIAYSHYEDALKDYKTVCEGGDNGEAFKRLTPGSNELQPLFDAAKALVNATSNSSGDFDFYKLASESLNKKMVSSYGKNFTVSYEVVEKQRMSKKEVEQEQDDFNNITSTMNQILNSDKVKSSMKSSENTEIKESEFKYGMKIKVKFTYKGDKKTEEKTEDIHIVKYDGHWSITKGLDSTFNSGNSKISSGTTTK